jgi:glycosyltransferase involved in cell wall biosynthesis
MGTPSLSVVIPALDEAANLEAAVGMIQEAVARRFADYDLIIVDDGSGDRTREIALAMVERDPHINVLSNRQTMGLGYSIRAGMALSNRTYTGWLPADVNTILSTADMARLVDAVGAADFVLLHLTEDRRLLHKRWLSRGFVAGMNLLFGLRLPYYNGANFFRTDIIRSVPLRGDGYELFSGTLIRLLRAGYSYRMLGVTNGDAHGSSKAFRLATFVKVVRAVSRLFWEVRIAPHWEHATGPRERVPVDLPGVAGRVDPVAAMVPRGEAA